MRELLNSASFEELSSTRDAVVLLSPPWSEYPKRTQATLSEIEGELGKEGIVVFIASEDDPAKNPLMASWIEQAEMQLLPGIATGAGALVACRSGVPTLLQTTTWNWSQDELRDWIVSAAREKQRPRTLEPRKA